jgi:hypothetical protein
VTANRVQSGDRVTVSSTVHARQFDDELIILDLGAGAYFALDAIGTRAWRGFTEGKSIEEVAGDFGQEYDVDFDRALADLLKLAEDLVSRGILVPASPVA